MATASAYLKNYRQAPRKVRLVADLVRGKSVPYALSLLDTLPKRAGAPLAKLLRSAISNAKRQGMNEGELVVSQIAVDKGLVFKRSMPRARGSASPIHKRSSHVSLILSSKK